MSADVLLARLDKPKKTGDGKWRARCPAHRGQSLSLGIKEEPDGRVLVHCFAGCAVENVLAAVQLDMPDLFPPRRVDDRVQSDRKPWRARDVIDALGFELDVGLVLLSQVARGVPISDEDRARAGVVALRIAHFRAELEHAR